MSQISEAIYRDAVEEIHKVEPISSSKSALVISLSDYETGDPSNWKPFMMPRELCETDERYLQIIPYVHLVNEHGEYFSYERGGAGNEARLHAKRSIGLGGHIDNPVTTTLDELIAVEAARELEEEVGLVVNTQKMLDALKHAIIIRETSTAVDRVHLGIAFGVSVHSSELKKLEQGVIINPLWLSPRMIYMHWMLKDLVKSDMLKWEFEIWSQIVLQVALETPAVTTEPETLNAFL